MYVSEFNERRLLFIRCILHFDLLFPYSFSLNFFFFFYSSLKHFFFSLIILSVHSIMNYLYKESDDESTLSTEEYHPLRIKYTYLYIPIIFHCAIRNIHIYLFFSSSLNRLMSDSSASFNNNN